ncbi:hypothetical protein [Streptomyces vinaceus]|uniref:hypothetical protein n=1 Tax=Streptomyces vinaceus TaxID=1960 RepID=UPI003684E2BB
MNAPPLHLDHHGCTCTRVSVDRHGTPRPEAVVAAVRLRTVPASVMHANNEIGTVQPIGPFADAVSEVPPYLRVRNHGRCQCVVPCVIPLVVRMDDTADQQGWWTWVIEHGHPSGDQRTDRKA